MPCQVPSTGLPPSTGIESCVWVSAAFDVRRHVVGAFVVVAIEGVLGRQAAEECFQIGANVWVGVVLDQQRCRRVAAPDGQQPGRDPLLRYPAAHRFGHHDHSLAVGNDVQHVQRLLHARRLVPGRVNAQDDTAWRRLAFIL